MLSGFQLRPYQTKASEVAADFLTSAPRGARLLIAGPTGSGKTPVILETKRRVSLDPNKLIITISPSDDILAGFASKMGITAATPKKLKNVLESLGYFTPVRLQNLMLKGSIARPHGLLIDETHHHNANTYQLIDALCDMCPAVGFTATPFRGTPRATAEFRKRWGEPQWMITFKEAVKEGFIAFPNCRVAPLLDDDIIEVVNGEFKVQSTEKQVCDVVENLIDLLRSRFGGNRPDRPTMLRMPGVYTAELYERALNLAGIPAMCVTGDTSPEDRTLAFNKTLDCDVVLMQVKVVGEGVDLPIRRLVDLAPMMSPVEWLQQLGRVTRPTAPTEAPPEYICTNRNLMRHAYLLDGMLPPSVYRECENAFPGPSKRNNVRAIGFEGLGRFTPVDIPLHNGTKGQMVCVTKCDNNGMVTEYAAIVSPLHTDPLYAMRVYPRGNYSGSKWQQITELPDIPTGYASIPPRPLPEEEDPANPKDARRRWWINAARFYGLDATATINAKQFQCLPILKDTSFRFR